MLSYNSYWITISQNSIRKLRRLFMIQNTHDMLSIFLCETKHSRQYIVGTGVWYPLYVWFPFLTHRFFNIEISPRKSWPWNLLLRLLLANLVPNTLWALYLKVVSATFLLVCFFKSKGDYLWNKAKCILFHFKSSFCARDNQVIEF